MRRNPYITGVKTPFDTDIIIFHSGSLMFLCLKCREAFVQINLMGHSNDSVSQHDFLICVVDTHFIQRFFQPKDMLQYIFQFLTEIFVGFLRRIGLFLQSDKQQQILKL